MKENSRRIRLVFINRALSDGVASVKLLWNIGQTEIFLALCSDVTFCGSWGFIAYFQYKISLLYFFFPDY